MCGFLEEIVNHFQLKIFCGITFSGKTNQLSIHSLWNKLKMIKCLLL